MNISDLQLGKAGEYLTIADLILSGYVAFPSEQGLPFDVVCDVAGRLIKIQVKTTRSPVALTQRVARKSAYLFHVMRSGKGGKTRYECCDVHIFALVALDIRAIAYIPMSQAKTTMQFRSPLETYQGDGKAELVAKIRSLREAGATLKAIGDETGKHFTYVQRVLSGKETAVKFGRKLDEFTFQRAIAELA
jgi:hypothetical protein